MMQTGTDPRLVKLRKYESILVISGFGVIAFGLWSIIRAAIYFFLNPLDIANYIEESDLAEIMAFGRDEGIEFITENLGSIVTALIFTYLGIDLLFRLYVGLSARKDGRRTKRRGFYLVITWLMTIFLFIYIVIYFKVAVNDYIIPIINALSEDADEAFKETGASGDQAAGVSIFVDITSFLVLLEVGICGIKVRRLRKQLGIKVGKRKKKDQKQLISEQLAEELKEELNIPMNKEEVKELGEEIGQQLSDGLSGITSVTNTTGE